MSNKQYFLIRQKKTNFLFPTTGRGSTHAEFSKFGIPRLFPSHHAARFCLDWWLKGKTVMLRSGNYYGEYDEDLNTTKVPGRIASDYEIIKAYLSIGD